MADQITVVGSVASDVEMGQLPSGDACASFRLASSRRRVNPETRRWEDAHVSWYRVRVTRQLAEHARVSLERGLRVIVLGRLTLREWERQGQRGMTAEIDAEALGLELLWRPARAADRTRRQLRAERAARGADRSAGAGAGAAGARNPGDTGAPGSSGNASRHWAPGAPGRVDGEASVGADRVAGSGSVGWGDAPGRSRGNGGDEAGRAGGNGGAERTRAAGSGGGWGGAPGRLSGPAPPAGFSRAGEPDGRSSRVPVIHERSLSRARARPVGVVSVAVVHVAFPGRAHVPRGHARERCCGSRAARAMRAHRP